MRAEKLKKDSSFLYFISNSIIILKLYDIISKHKEDNFLFIYPTTMAGDKPTGFIPNNTFIFKSYDEHMPYHFQTP